MPRSALLTAAALGAVAMAVAAPAATAAPTDPIVGVWNWTDRDEALANRANAGPVTFTATKGVVRVRMGRRGSTRVAWNPTTMRFGFVATRKAGPKGKATVRVRYTGRVARRADGRWTAAGTFRIVTRGYPGSSAFSAVKRP